MKQLAIVAIALLLLAGCAAGPPPTPTHTPIPPSPTPIPATVTPEPALIPTAVPEPTDTPVPPDPTAIPALTKDLAYTISLAPAVLEQKLDVYTPGREQNDAWPVVVVAHGFMQKKRDFRMLSEEIAEQGAVVFTIDWPTYTGSSTVRENGKQVREMAETLACAVRYADAHAAEYGGDPDRIIFVGFSMGAGMGGLISLAGETTEAEWATLAEQTGEPADQIDCVAPEGSAVVDAFVGIAGPYDMFGALQGRKPRLVAHCRSHRATTGKPRPVGAAPAWQYRRQSAGGSLGGIQRSAARRGL